MIKTNNKLVLLIVVLILIAGAIVFLDKDKINSSSSQIESSKVSSSKEPIKLIDGIEYPLSPELSGISGYLNTNDEQIKIADFEGKVVLVDFWTYTCINCIRTLPYLTSWDEKYRNNGLAIIGVHAPEFEFEKEKENVEKAIDRYGIKYPVVQDNEKGTWKAFNNRYWPAKYLIDSEGYIRYIHFGEGAYEETELEIQKLLNEAGYNADKTLTEETQTSKNRITPEIYAGSLFALAREQYIGNKKTISRNENYILPKNIKEDIIYLNGNWTHNTDNLQFNEGEGQIALQFTASEANIVAAPLINSKVVLEIKIDGAYLDEENAGSDVQFSGAKSFIIIDEDRLYNLFMGDYGNHRLDLKINESFSFNAFTFG